MTKNRAPTPVYLDPGMHSGLEVKGLIRDIETLRDFNLKNLSTWQLWITVVMTGFER